MAHDEHRAGDDSGGMGCLLIILLIMIFIYAVVASCNRDEERDARAELMRVCIKAITHESRVADTCRDILRLSK